jgi:hypothetical protein
MIDLSGLWAHVFALRLVTAGIDGTEERVPIREPGEDLLMWFSIGMGKENHRFQA